MKKKNKKTLLKKVIRKRKIVFGVFAVVSLTILTTFLVFMIICFSKANDSTYIYAAVLKRMMVLNCCICLFCFCLVWGGCIACLKIGGFEFFEFWVVLLLALAVCGCFAYGFGTMRNHYLDLSKEDCVIYQGSFEKDAELKAVYDFIYLDDGTRLENIREKTALKKGKYTGTIVYSKRTKYILDVDLDIEAD